MGLLAWNDRTNFDRNLAVVIGIDQYNHDHISNLSTPVSDANAFADLLKTKFEYKPEYILHLTNDQATLSGLRTLLDDTLPNQINPTESDRLIFYFAGHGLPINSDDGPQGYLVPQNADPSQAESFLSMNKVYDALNKLQCHHLLVILDCCFAGMFRWASSRKAIVKLEKIYREHYDRFIRFPAWQLITSSAHDQEALDIAKLSQDRRGKVDDQNHSPFALALLEALQDGDPDFQGQQHLRGDYTKDGVITAHELIIYLRDRVSQLSKERQVPGLYPLNRKYDRGEFIFVQPGFDPRHRLSSAPELNEENNPYRGLKPFEERHAQFFFGRQEVIQQLSILVSQPGQQLTAVLGISGSGKSSLVKAGLIPYLRKNKEWHILEPMRPGEYPFAALARTILAITNETLTTEIKQIIFLNTACQEKAEQFESLAIIWNNASLDKKLLLLVDRFEELKTACRNSNEEQQLEKLKNTIQDSIKNLIVSLQTETQELINIITAWSQAHSNIKLLLIIDQFEDLITLSHNNKEDNNQEDKKEWQQFLNLLVQAVKSCSHLCVVLTLRSDFETRFIGSPLNAYWAKARFPVRPMRSDELRQAIVEPASEMALYFEPPNLVDRLIDEIGQMPGALPLLSFTLSELYIKLYNQSKGQEKPQRSLTIDENFVRQGGVAGSITSRANAEYALLANDAERTTMRWVMLRMLTIEGWEASRRQVPDSELVYPNLEENQRVTKVIEHLVQARLVVKGRETGEPYVEPAHDFLVRGWDMLQDWIKENRDELMLQQRLIPAANDWYNNGRRSDLLWSDGDRLRQLEKISASPYNWLNRRETDFIESSIQQVKEHQARENLLNEAKKISDVIENEPFDVLIRSIKAVGQNLEQLPNQVLDRVQFNLHTAMEMSRESNILQGHKDSVSSVAFSPDGLLIISSSHDKTVRLWDIQGNPIGQPLLGHDGWVNSVAFSPDGQLIVTGSDDETVRLWDIDGNLIGQPLQHEDVVTSVAFRCDGQMIVSGNQDNKVWLWDIKGNRIGQPFQGHTFLYVNSVAFSPDGQMIASGGDDNTVRLWDINGNLIRKLVRKHNSIVNSVVFSPNGQKIISGHSDHTVCLWDVQFHPVGQPLQGHNSTVNSVAVSSDGQLIVSASRDKTVRLWDIQGNLIRKLSQENDSNVSSVAFSPDGQLIASGSVDTTVRLWNIQGNPIGQPFRGHNGWVSSVAFSPDGQLIVSASRDKTVRLWNINGNSIGEPLQHEDFVNSAAFSPDGQLIVSGSSNKIVSLWDIKGNRIGQPLLGHGDSVNSVAFSPDGLYIVSGSSDGTVRLWDIEGNSISPPFKGLESGVYSVTFSPDGQLIVSGGEGMTVHLWWGGWKPWLQVCCNRLQYHPVFRNPQTEVEQHACNTCKNFVWTPQVGAENLYKQVTKRIEQEYFKVAAERNFSAIVATLHLVIHCNPIHADAYYYRGKCYIQLNNKHQATKDFQKAAALYQQLGQTSSEEYQEVIKFLNSRADKA